MPSRRNPNLRIPGLRGILAATLLVLVGAGPTATAVAAAKKEASPQQQKMKDCAAKWGEEKKTKNVSGKKAHTAFMSTCLKG
jgi:hypothetical protein